jgi:hypothetical protein
MTPTAPVYLGTDFDGMVHGLEQKIEDANELGERLSEFLCAAFPLAAQQGIALGGAVARFLVSGYAEHIDALKHQRAVSAPYFKNSPVEQLTELCKHRDRYQEQMDQADSMMEKLKGTPFEDVMSIGVQAMMNQTKQQLDFYNDRISEIQREMEKAEA